jgi:hypothetical protein
LALKLAAVGLDDLQRQQHVVDRGAPGQQAGRLEGHAADLQRPGHRLAVDRMVPLLGIFRPVVSFMKVDLPQPDGPTMAMNSPWSPAARCPRPRSGPGQQLVVVGQPDVAEVDEGGAVTSSPAAGR